MTAAQRDIQLTYTRHNRPETPKEADYRQRVIDEARLREMPLHQLVLEPLSIGGAADTRPVLTIHHDGIGYTAASVAGVQDTADLHDLLDSLNDLAGAW